MKQISKNPDNIKDFFEILKASYQTQIKLVLVF